jgi:O-antigen/teichoic acid export membrane protein
MIIKHTFYNLLGLGLPMIAAIFSIPILISELGVDRFGLLTLIWALVSYLGLFDLGLGRALTLQAGKIFESKNKKQLTPLILTALLLMSLFGILASSLLAFFATPLVDLISSNIDKHEVINATYVMAFVLPVITLTSALRGILEANHSFGIINLIRLPMGIFTFLSPLIVIFLFEPRLDFIAIILALGRVIACLIHGFFVWKILQKNVKPPFIDIKFIKPLLVSGSWMTVSNIVSPFMGYIDRFLIGFILSASSVAYYATPHEMVTKLTVIPGALTGVLFPTFLKKSKDNVKLRNLFFISIFLIFFTLLPFIITLEFFSKEILSAWINDEFSERSSILLQIFALGVLINSATHVPFTLIQSLSKPHITAIIHMIELPFFLILLWVMILKFGILGAALAWLARIITDSILMFIFAMPLIKAPPRKFLLDIHVKYLFLIILFSFIGILVHSIFIRSIIFIFLMALIGLIFLGVYKKADFSG